MEDTSQSQDDHDHDYEDGHLPIEEIHARRKEELEALHAYYGNDVTSSLRSSETAPHRNARRRPSTDEDDASAVEGIPIAGPWFLRIRHPSNDFATDAIPGHQSDNAHGNSHREDGRGLGIPTLEIRLPASYPLGATAPTPVLHNVMMNPDKKRNLLEELVEMYEVDVEVSILWGERCREELLHSEDSLDLHNHCRDGVCYENGNDHAADYENDKHDDDNDNHSNKHGGEKQTDTTTYLPPTTKFNQPIRTFPTHIINNPLHQRTIARTRPFHPPKSGPGETMIGHAARVTSPEHVQWVLVRLLFHDTKVAKADHNILRFKGGTQSA